jgi:bacterioferritin
LDTAQIVALLNEDIRGEHAAIIQYLLHAYAMGEDNEAAGELEAIAREEMRHLKWLAEMVVELGGTPTMERGEVDTTGDTPAQWLARNMLAEEQAINLYREHIKAIDQPKITLLLERIIHDELVHGAEFDELLKEVEEEDEAPIAPIRPEDDTVEPSRPLEILLKGVEHEYTVILQYLYHSFMTPHCKIADELEWQAVNEMQHMGWLAEEMAERGAYPRMEHTPFDQSEETTEMLRADIAAERAVIRDYDAQLKELEAADEDELVELISRVRDHEVYHDALFSGLLQELEEGEASE